MGIYLAILDAQAQAHLKDPCAPEGRWLDPNHKLSFAPVYECAERAEKLGLKWGVQDGDRVTLDTLVLYAEYLDALRRAVATPGEAAELEIEVGNLREFAKKHAAALAQGEWFWREG